MQIDPRFIGFTASSRPRLFPSPVCATFFDSPFPRDLLRPRAHPLSLSPLQSSFAASPRSKAFRPELHLPQVSCPPRDFTRAQPLFAKVPIPSLRSVPRFSQPLDGFLRAPACGLISSRCHVQGLSRSGASLHAQPPFLFGRSLPPGRWTKPRSPPCGGSPHGSALDFEAFICARPRSMRRRYSPRRTPLPSSGSLLLQALTSHGRSQLTHDLRSRRWFVTHARSRGSRLGFSFAAAQLSSRLYTRSSSTSVVLRAHKSATFAAPSRSRRE